jgi:hypothetical protein
MRRLSPALTPIAACFLNAATAAVSHACAQPIMKFCPDDEEMVLEVSAK